MMFENKIVLITGAGSGIGKEAAIAFANEGGTVIVSDINEASGKETAKLILDSGGKASFCKADVANFDEVKQLVDFCKTNYGRLDIAINNAGISGTPAKTIDTTPAMWDQVMSINANGVFYCMNLQLKLMLQQGGGVILNTASVAGLRGLPNGLPYVASKHAVVGMTKTAAMEYARNNIRVNAICPAFTVTNLFKPEVMEQISEGLSQKLMKAIPMKRFAEASEIAATMLWICSDQASFVTGQAISVDGGLTA